MAQRRRRLGLTSRIALIFSLGALLLTSTVATATYLLLQDSLLDEASQSAQAQAWRNARDIENGLLTAAAATGTTTLIGPEIEDAVGSVLSNTLRTNGARVALVVGGDVPYSPSGLLSRDIPAALKVLVQKGEAGQFRYLQDGEAQLGVGLWIADIKSEYYEIVPLKGVEGTLSSLRTVMIGVTFFASALGALLGWYTARRSLLPIASVTSAAEAIAAGDFSTRLDPAIDPDLRGLSASFNHMVDALAARIERDERFASDVSHELRSPLMTLTASVEVLERRQDELPDAASQAVQLLSKDLRRFSSLVEDLLEISRIDAGAAQLEESGIAIFEFLQAVVRQSRSPNIPIRFEQGDEDIFALVDKRRLAQVFSNLIDNAGKYGNGVTEIIYGKIDEDEVEIRVIDSGPGVPVEDRDRIFHRFTRAGADAGRRETAKGVGLGLSLAFEHIRLHGGAIGVRDRDDGQPGAVFYVRLPVGQIPDEEMAW